MNSLRGGLVTEVAARQMYVLTSGLRSVVD